MRRETPQMIQREREKEMVERKWREKGKYMCRKRKGNDLGS
jgi:hypothetical protein